MRVLGIDPSLRCTGLCTTADGVYHESSTIPTQDLRGISRLLYIEDKIAEAYADASPDIIVMEGYAMGIKGGRVFDIGELGYAIKRVLHFTKTPVWIVPPTSLKQFVTEKGNAKKDAIHTALLNQYDVDLKSNDEADAFGLSLMGQYIVNNRLRRKLSAPRAHAIKAAQRVL